MPNRLQLINGEKKPEVIGYEFPPLYQLSSELLQAMAEMLQQEDVERPDLSDILTKLALELQQIGPHGMAIWQTIDRPRWEQVQVRGARQVELITKLKHPQPSLAELLPEIWLQEFKKADIGVSGSDDHEVLGPPLSEIDPITELREASPEDRALVYVSQILQEVPYKEKLECIKRYIATGKMEELVPLPGSRVARAVQSTRLRDWDGNKDFDNLEFAKGLCRLIEEKVSLWEETLGEREEVRRSTLIDLLQEYIKREGMRAVLRRYAFRYNPLPH